MRRSHAAVLSLTALLLTSAALPAAASPPLTQRKSLTVYRDALVNGVPLAAGAYRVELASSLDSVTFLKGRKVVVTAPCRVGLVPKPVNGDTVHFRPLDDGREEIVRIEFSGSSVSIDLGPQVKGPPIAETGTGR